MNIEHICFHCKWEYDCKNTTGLFKHSRHHSISRCCALITTGNVIDDNRQTDGRTDRSIDRCWRQKKKKKDLFFITNWSIDRFIEK